MAILKIGPNLLVKIHQLKNDFVTKASPNQVIERVLLG